MFVYVVKVRDKLKSGQSIEQQVGALINEYSTKHRLGAKMNGLEEWTQEEKELVKFTSR